MGKIIKNAVFRELVNSLKRIGKEDVSREYPMILNIKSKSTTAKIGSVGRCRSMGKLCVISSKGTDKGTKNVRISINSLREKRAKNANNKSIGRNER